MGESDKNEDDKDGMGWLGYALEWGIGWLEEMEDERMKNRL